MAGRVSGGVCLMIAGGSCVWDDIRDFYRLYDLDFDFKDPSQEPPVPVFGVNDIGSFFKARMEHLVSIHEEQLFPVLCLRHPNGCNTSHTTTHTLKPQREASRKPWYKPADIHWRFTQGVGGTSAMVACQVALAIGYSKAVLAGVPLDGGAHFFYPRWGRLPYFDSDTQKIEWHSMMQHRFHGRVRSMSGRTAQWLGKPSQEWIHDYD